MKVIRCELCGAAYDVNSLTSADLAFELRAHVLIEHGGEAKFVVAIEEDA